MENNLVPAILVLLLTLVCVLVVFIGLIRTTKATSWPEDTRKRFLKRSIVTVVLWIVLIGVLSGLGFFRVTDSLPPRPVLILLFSIASAILISRSRAFSEILSVTPLSWPIYIQSFRVFVELILWQGYCSGLLPVQMTFEGNNFDILSGLLALPAGWIIDRNPSLARGIGISYNVVGMLLLINILAIAVLSMPTSLRYFENEPANVIVGEFPFIYIPAVFVVLAIFMHVFSLRQLLMKMHLTQNAASMRS
jgi:hypothetical protein